MQVRSYVIYPYQLNVFMPVGAQILTLKHTRTLVSVVALVDVEAKMEIRRFSVFKNDEDISQWERKFIGMVELTDVVSIYVFEDLNV